ATPSHLFPYTTLFRSLRVGLQMSDLRGIERGPHLLPGHRDVLRGHHGGVDVAPHRRERGLAQQRRAVRGRVAVESGGQLVEVDRSEEHTSELQSRENL